MSERHTPGPWKWFDYPDGRKLLAAPSQAVIHCPDAAMTVDEADQVLIASAPDLLAERDRLRAIAAQAIAAVLEHHDEHCPAWCGARAVAKDLDAALRGMEESDESAPVAGR